MGMMLLAASPGGPSANLYSHLFGGNVAFNVTLTAVNSVLTVITLLTGYGLPRLLGIGKPEAIAAGMEIGIHNATLAITVAVSPALLGNSAMAVSPAVYGIIMFFTATAFGFMVTRRRGSRLSPTPG